MSRITADKDCVISDRGGILENKHNVHAAVVDSSAKILYCVGNATRVTFARSAVKPVQALAVLETGAVDQFGFDGADLALMCASHSSEDRHLSRVRAMLAKVGAEEADLRCGGHPALSEAVDRGWIMNGYVPTAICNDCSGKHAGMLAGARAIGADLTDYHLPTHPIQLQVKKVTEEFCDMDKYGVKWGIDGCNLPAPAFPLNDLGRMFATLADSIDAVKAEEIHSTTQTRYLARIFRAMTMYPEMIGGEGRFCTLLMRAFDGLLVGKVGADGCYGIGVRASARTRQLGAHGALGIAVKVEDGNREILYAAVMEILEQLQIGTPEMRREMAAFHHLARLNTMGVVIGHVSFAFKVRPFDSAVPVSEFSKC